ncbi:unnamed protein product [Camellia sinensis]
MKKRVLGTPTNIADVLKNTLLGKTVIKRMRSLDSASFDCDGMPGLQFNAEDKRQTIVQILDEVCHPKELRLCSCYILALSSGEGRDFMTFAVTCLRIKTGLTKWELPGIAYMLRHSPNIETLIISIDKNEEKKRMTSQIANLIMEMEKNTGKCRSQIFSLFDLKTVKLYYFMRNLHGRMSTTTAELLEQLQNKMNFLRFLLKNLKVLEKMIITTCKGVDFG